jgi:hypothetical protein
MQLIHRLDGPGDRDSEFRRSEIPDGGLTLRRSASGGVKLVRARGAHAEDVARIVPFVENEARQAALIVAPGVRDLTLGGLRPVDVCVLAERDEIVLGGSRAYFTTRSPLVVSRHEHDACCGVCGDPVRGCEVIACTHCAAVTHAGAVLDGDPRDCFEHRGSCPGCGLRKQDFEWMPENAIEEDDRARRDL